MKCELPVDPRSDGERSLHPVAGVGRSLCQGPVGGDTQSERIAGDMPFNASRGEFGFFLTLSPQDIIRVADPLARGPYQPGPDRQKHGGEDQEEFGSGGQRSKAPARFAQHGWLPDKGLAELPQQVAEVVGNGFAQRIVVHRAQRAQNIH